MIRLPMYISAIGPQWVNNNTYHSSTYCHGSCRIYPYLTVTEWGKASHLNDLRADSRLVPSQCETLLQSNAVSHWLGTNLESAMWPWWVKHHTLYWPGKSSCRCTWILLPQIWLCIKYSFFNTLKQSQNGCHFAWHIFKLFFLHDNSCIWIISLKFVLNGQFDNKSALVQIMAWYRQAALVGSPQDLIDDWLTDYGSGIRLLPDGTNPFPEPMLIKC